MLTKKLFAIALLISILPVFTTGPVVYAVNMSDEVEAKQLDERAEILSAYFAQYNSVLQYHAQDFIDAADANEMDWKLVPAIAGVESTFCKFIPGGHGPYTTYNCWGWGVYGDQALGFKSWRDGIFTVSTGLKKNYINRGLTDPYSMNRVYAASPSWGWKVDYFLKDLERFAANYKQPIIASGNNLLSKTAGASAQLAYR